METTLQTLLYNSGHHFSESEEKVLFLLQRPIVTERIKVYW